MKDILIVEDGHQERERLEKLFSAQGYAVTACESVAEAEKTLKAEAYRIAILDIGLSDKSGSYLFSLIRRSHSSTYVLIFTGNPSSHLKQRFLDEGAVDYIVKASSQAQNDNFLNRIREIIGEPHKGAPEGMDLEEFLSRYVTEASRKLFFDDGQSFPSCTRCKERKYVVVFSHQAQVPPEIQGSVVCQNCGQAMDPEVP